ncbi:MAG: TIGR03435 family protein [Candidatus Sulfopaludibacter sp.]|nr:TIGR03435 family protein [Candidatus Sulfopaludibacter sp.]
MLVGPARIGLIVLTGYLLHGQTVDKTLTFDAASVKQATLPGAGGRGRVMFAPTSGGPGTNDPGRIHYPYTSLKALLMSAYDVKDFQISGPEWLDTEGFDITATMPPETTQEQFRVMLQNLLAERFKMTSHRETRELPMYSLTVAKGGPKMRESVEEPAAASDADPPPPPSQPKMGPDGFPIVPLPGRAGIFTIMMPTRARFTAQKQTMRDFAGRLTRQLSRPVTDLTGLKTQYDFILTFSPEGMSGPMGPMVPPAGAVPAGGPIGAPADTEAAPDIFAAVQAQLGLKLEAKKGPVEMIVIDHIEKTATEN